MQVTVTPFYSQVTVRVRVIDPMGTHTAADTVTRCEPMATVDGVPWTVAQTAQALRDSSLCRCGSCACCRIAAEARSFKAHVRS